MLLGQALRSVADNPSRVVLFKMEWRIVAMQRYEGVQEYFCCVREDFVVEVMRFGERGAK